MLGKNLYHMAFRRHFVTQTIAPGIVERNEDMPIVVPMFPGEMLNNVYSSQMGHLPQTRVIVPPKASFNKQGVYWVPYRDMREEVQEQG